MASVKAEERAYRAKNRFMNEALTRDSDPLRDYKHPDAELLHGLTEEKFQKRMAFANELDSDFRATYPQRNVKAYSDM